MPGRPYVPTEKAHRALDDVHSSLNELRYYRGLLFRPAEAFDHAPSCGRRDDHGPEGCAVD